MRSIPMWVNFCINVKIMIWEFGSCVFWDIAVQKCEIWFGKLGFWYDLEACKLIPEFVSKSGSKFGFSVLKFGNAV